MPNENANTDRARTAAGVAAAIGVSAAMVLGIWDAYRGSEVAAGRADPEIAAASEPEQMLAAVVDLGNDAGQCVVELRAKRSYLKAGAGVIIPELGHAIVVKACGSVKQRAHRCPEWYPDEKRCACCCPAGTVVAGDCKCLVDDCRLTARSTWTDCSVECVGLPDPDGGLEVVDGGCTRTCPDAAVECAPGDLCRYARTGEDQACDPDQAGCVEWPCWVYAGDDPGEVARQDDVDGGVP